MTFVTKQDLSGAFSNKRPVEIPAPELGEGKVVRFKPEFSVNDMLVVSELQLQFKSASAFIIALARQALVDGDGNPLVDPDNDAWFMEGANAAWLVKYAAKAKLVERYIDAMEDADTDRKDADTDTMRQVVASVALTLNVTPDDVLAMSQPQLIDLLKAVRERNKPNRV